MNSGDQSLQEKQYAFPYHHIPTFRDGNFKQVQHLPWGYEYMAYIHFIIKKMQNLSFNTLLDVGCGDAKFLYESEHIFKNKSLFGTDTSKKAISFARAMCTDKTKFFTDDVTDKDTSLGTYDIVTSIEVLEHIPPTNSRDFIEGMWKHIKKDGLLILTVPSTNAPLIKKHYRHFDAETLEKELSPFFDIQEVLYLNKKSFVGDKVLRRFFGNKLFFLNSQRILNLLYRFYTKHFLAAQKHTGRRICIIAKKKD